MKTTKLICDVLVIGGGPAGVPCAIAAARNGCDVILCQDRSVLGGNSSSEIRMHIVGADSNGHRSEPLATEARETGIIEEIRLDCSVRNPQRSASMLDLIYYEKCRAERNIRLFLNTTIVGVRVVNNKIVSAIGERQSTLDKFIIEAKIFIDCTGDGRVGYEAGAEFRHGREDKLEFGESLANDVADRKTLGSTLLFTARKHENPMPFIPPKWVRKFSEEDLKFRPHAEAGLDKGIDYGYWWAEWGGQLDTIRDNEVIRDELLAIILGVWDHIKNSGDHGAENWALDWFGFLPGKRESRRFVGLYTLTQNDLLESKEFYDAIAYGGWPIDTHPPEGVDRPNERPSNLTVLPYLYDIPLRSCISKNISNLMFAGRNISASHIAFASTRVMATCAVIGQGVGTSAAHAVSNALELYELVSNHSELKLIQQKLLKDDCYLVGRLNEDSRDYARQALISASSEQLNGAAINIISGQTRSVHGEGGAPKSRNFPGSHRWMSEPSQGFPSWVKLEWKDFIKIREIHLTFDTGLSRLLTLSHCEDYSPTMIWGKPQPETIKDYDIEYKFDDEWVKILSIRNNWQRKNINILDLAIVTNKIRIVVLGTNGINHSRILEIRVYS